MIDSGSCITHQQTYKRMKRYCQLTEDEKHRYSDRRGVLLDNRPYTAFFRTQSPAPLTHPPDLSRHLELTLGDIYCHHSDRGIQLWLLIERHGKQAWEPVRSLGIHREADGRRLSLAPSSNEPSWVGPKWYHKQELKHATFREFISRFSFFYQPEAHVRHK